MTPIYLITRLYMELALLRQVQALEAQLSQLSAVVEPIPATSTAQIEQIPTSTPSCILFDHYGNPLFCGNNLPSFCPSASVISNWNNDIQSYGGNGMQTNKDFLALSPRLSYDQEINCGMLQGN